MKHNAKGKATRFTPTHVIELLLLPLPLVTFVALRTLSEELQEVTKNDSF
jgi:hypothetical protein